MALYYGLVFSLLIIEMILFALISLPLPSKLRKPLLKFLYIPFNSSNFKIVLKCIFVFITILFIDSLNRMNKINNELFELAESGGGNVVLGSGESRSEIQARRFYAQRNTYLCGFTLFLTIVLNRTYSLVFQLLTIKESIKKENDGKAIDALNAVDDAEFEKLKTKIAEQDELIDKLKRQASDLSSEYEKI